MILFCYLSVICVGSELKSNTDCIHRPYKTHCNAEGSGFMLTYFQKQYGRFGCKFGQYCSLRHKTNSNTSQKFPRLLKCHTCCRISCLLTESQAAR